MSRSVATRFRPPTVGGRSGCSHRGFRASSMIRWIWKLRSLMQLGACFAGMAIETSMLGAAHATANPLTARYDITHGQAVGLMLPAVIRMNGSIHADWYAELLREVDPTVATADAPERLAGMVTQWLREAGLATTLRRTVDPDIRDSTPCGGCIEAVDWNLQSDPPRCGPDSQLVSVRCLTVIEPTKRAGDRVCSMSLSGSQ